MTDGRIKKGLQRSVIATIAAILVFPGSSFVIGQPAPLSVTITEPPDGSILNTADLAVNGTASGANLDIVEVLLDNASQGNATLTNSTWTTGLTFTEGQHNVTAVARDTGNGTASDSISITVDLISPTVEITSPANLEELNTGAVTVNGTASDANGIQSVRVKINEGPFENATGTDEWSFEASLSDGNHTITAQAVDSAGNTNSTSIEVSVDTQGPDLTITFSLNDAILNTSEVSISGNASDANGIASVEVSIDGSGFQVADGTTAWSFTTPALEDGSHNATARATDTFGNTGEDSVSFTIDTQAPAITLSSPSDGDKINSANVTIAGTADGSSVESVTVSIDGSELAPASFNSTSGEWSFEGVDLEDGGHMVNATAADSAGNVATAPTVSFIVDTVVPEIEITLPENGATLTTSNAAITGTTSDLNGITMVEVSIDEGDFMPANGTESWSIDAVLENGNHTITARATDMAGNTNTTSISVNVETEEQLSLTSIEGVVFQDINNDGIRQVNETGIQNWMVWIGGFDTSILQRVLLFAQTDANGRYQFSDLNSGFYMLIPDPEEGATVTLPDSGRHIVNLPLPSGMSFDFGIHLTTPLDEIVPPVGEENQFSNCIIKGKLKINGVTATLSQCDIRGKIEIKNDAIVTIQDSSVRGNIKVRDGGHLNLISTDVKGNVDIKHASISIEGQTGILGNLKIKDAQMTHDGTNTISGNIQIRNGGVSINEEEHDEEEHEEEDEDQEELEDEYGSDEVESQQGFVGDESNEDASNSHDQNQSDKGKKDKDNGKDNDKDEDKKNTNSGKSKENSDDHKGKGKQKDKDNKGGEKSKSKDAKNSKGKNGEGKEGGNSGKGYDEDEEDDDEDEDDDNEEDDD